MGRKGMKGKTKWEEREWKEKTKWKEREWKGIESELGNGREKKKNELGTEEV